LLPGNIFFVEGNFFQTGNFKALALYDGMNKMEASSRDSGVPVSSQAKSKQLSIHFPSTLNPNTRNQTFLIGKYLLH
jgi:hypothetical protein